ncbi:MAG: SLC13 family permease [Halobacteriales archaeon]
MAGLDRTTLTRHRLGLALGPVTFAVVYWVAPTSAPPSANAVLAATIWIAIWWMTEAIPIPATALLPVVIFPLVGPGDVADATRPYADPINFLLLGGFLLALGIERWGLHRRLALAVLERVGTRTDRLVLGFMLTAGFLSMWISNSATAMLMVPIGMAVLASVGGERATHMVEGVAAPLEETERGRIGLALMLGIAYGASIGGVATLIGSPPNAVFAGVAESSFGVEVSFLDWLVLAGPIAAVFLVVAWWAVLRLVRPRAVSIPGGDAHLAAQREALGHPSRPERRVAAVFATVALAWMLRPLGLESVVPGLSDAAIAVLGGLALFAIPSGTGAGRLLGWDDVGRLPWGVLVLLGAGFSIASAFQQSGLDVWIGEQLVAVGDVGAVVTVGLVVLTVVFLTEVNSNTATASVFMPIMAAIGVTLGFPPLQLMAAAALSASFAFMLPVATPPNAIVFASGAVTVPEMSRVGLWLNLLAVVAITLTVVLWMPVALSLVA